MVEYSWQQYDLMFDALGDKTRRDILWRVSKCELSISQIASKYKLSFAAVSKHIKVLQSAKLIKKRKKGKQRLISANKQTLTVATNYLKQYEAMWQQRFDHLEQLISEGR